MINRSSEIARYFWQTGKLPCPIYDFHGHMGEHAAIYLPHMHTDEMIRDMDAAGIRWLIFSHHQALDDPINGEVSNVEAVRRYPERLKAYFCMHSRNLDPQRHIQGVENAPDVYVGFKLLGDYELIPISDRRHYPYYEYLNETKKMLLLHTWDHSEYDGYQQVAQLAERFPDMIIICGHSFFSEHKEGISCTKQYPNVYYELTAIPIIRGYLEEIVACAGSERVLFGTDLPWFSTMHGVGMVLSADITDDDRLNIFCRNGERLLSRFSWFNR